MTDTRLAQSFLTHLTIDELSDRAFRVYVNGLVYAVGHGTDGLVPHRAVRLLHPSGNQHDAVAELIRAGLWSVVDGGWSIRNFLDYQTPAEQVERTKTLNRLRQQRARERKSEQDLSRVTERVTSDVTSKDRTETGQDRTSVRGAELSGLSSPSPWPPVRAVGGDA